MLQSNKTSLLVFEEDTRESFFNQNSTVLPSLVIAKLDSLFSEGLYLFGLPVLKFPDGSAFGPPFRNIYSGLSDKP